MKRMRGLLRTWLVIAAGLAVIPSVLAADAPGELDPTFGGDGRVTADLLPGAGLAVALQPDGKIVTAGPGFSIARFDSAGELDSTFGGDGSVAVEAVGSRAVALQADGRIVIAGSAAPGGFCCQFGLARLETNGALDSTFGAGGTVTTPFGGLTEALAVAIQPDGKIVAAGSTFSPFGDGFALARYNADGSLDATFGTAGKVTTDLGGFGDGAQAIVIQADGRIVAAGGGGSGNDFALVRYLADGTLDGSFGVGGRASTDFGGFDRAYGLALQADGRLVAAGDPGSGAFALARYAADGKLDPNFDGDGKLTTSFGGDARGRAVALQENGKIVAAGFAIVDFDSKFALARYMPDGQLDAAFGAGGRVTTDFGDPADVGVLCPPARSDCSNDHAEDVAVQPDGRILAVGGAGPCVPSCFLAMARYAGDATVLAIRLDIKPGSEVNPLKSRHGVIPVAILSTTGFDATSVDAASVCFGDAEDETQRDCTEAHGTGHVEDADGDGRPDLVMHFEAAETGIDVGDEQACLSGVTADGRGVTGCDVVRTS